MRILLLEEDLIVRKDIEMQLRKYNFDVLSDPTEKEIDYVIVGQGSAMQQLNSLSEKQTFKARFIFFVTSPDQANLENFSKSACASILLKPARVEQLLLHLIPPSPGNSLINTFM